MYEADLTKIRNMILSLKISINCALDDPGSDADKLGDAYEKLNDAYDALCDASEILNG